MFKVIIERCVLIASLLFMFLVLDYFLIILIIFNCFLDVAFCLSFSLIHSEVLLLAFFVELVW